MEEHGEETGGGWGWWDTAELIPVIGNVIGMVREAKKGAGSDALAEIGKKVDNIATHLTNSDVTGAVRDILGKPVIINGKQYDHLGEVEEALSGLGRQLKKIKKGMTENTFKGDTYQEAERILADLSKQKDKITNILNKATKL